MLRCLAVPVLSLIMGVIVGLACHVTLASAQQSPGIIPETKTAVTQKKQAPKRAAKTTPRTPPAKTSAAKPDATADVFAGISADDRVAIEAALSWSGDIASAANGDDPMLAAVKNFQKRSKAKITGTLTADERARLVGAAKEYRQEFGWTIVADPATGARLGVPLKLMPQTRDAARGTRWSSEHGEVTIETFRIKDAGGLSALFDSEKKEPASRRVESSALHNDDFSVTGLQGLKKFLVIAKTRDGEVRGFTLLYDQAMEGIVAPAAAAIANAFTPFPNRTAPFAAPVKTVDYGTGLVVSDAGHLVTARRLTQGCQVIVAAGLGDADRIADDPESGLALLRIYGARKVAALPLANALPQPGEVTLAGIPDPKGQDGRKALIEIKARLTRRMALELDRPVPMAGLAGAAALDAGGNFLGLTEMASTAAASATAVAPPLRLVPARTIRAFLEARDIAPTPGRRADAKASIVRIICVHK
jgi:hypothetical protein